MINLCLMILLIFVLFYFIVNGKNKEGMQNHDNDDNNDKKGVNNDKDVNKDKDVKNEKDEKHKNRQSELHVFHYLDHPNCMPRIRKGGMLMHEYDKYAMYSNYPRHLRYNKYDKSDNSNKYDKFDDYEDYGTFPDERERKNKSKVYNYGAPGTLTDKKKLHDMFRVKYTRTPSVTGMFTNTGPPGFNECILGI